MIKKGGIALRFAVTVLASTTIIFIVIFGSGYIHSRDTILRNVEENARNLTHRMVNRIEGVLVPVEKVPLNLAATIEKLDIDELKLLELLHRTLGDNPDIFGSTIAFEPYVFANDQQYFAPYLSRSGTDIKTRYLGGEAYYYFHHDWYQIPRETGMACWSEPYFDDGGGNILLATYSLPFLRDRAGGSRFTGVITADISLEWLEKIISEIHIYQSGYGFIVSRTGTFVVHPEKRWIMNETIFSIAEARDDSELRKVGKQMIRGQSGLVSFTGDPAGRPGLLYFAPIGLTNWSLGIFFPNSELMADLVEFNRKVISLAASGIVLLVLVVWLVSRTITRPLTALSETAREMATGQLDIDIPGLEKGGEVGVLAGSFHYLRDSLKTHIQHLIETNAAKERIESELSIARDIQMGLLPKIFPPFPDITGLDIHAFLKPAREVGGDLYDFYRIDDERICFVIGDVSGKGVPASLFMAVTMTLIKMTAAKGADPAQILQEVNSQLSKDNPSCMFVTLFCGILNTHTGELYYANGGHNLPVLIKKDGRLSFVEGTDGILLGASEDAEYDMKKLVLEAGDGLFLYSDGVTEAMDEKETLFSEERLFDRLSVIGETSAEEVVNTILREVTAFAGDAPQADDIALMVIRFCPTG